MLPSFTRYSNMKQVSHNSTLTVLTIVSGLLVLYIVFHLEILVYFAMVIGVVSILSQFARQCIHLAWMKLTELLGFIMPNVVLTLVFFVVLTPVATMSKIFTRNNPLMLKNNKKSTFIDVNRDYSKEYFEQPW